MYTKKSAIVKIQAAMIAIVIVVGAVGGVFAYYTYFAPKPSPAPPAAKIPIELAGKYVREDYPKDYIELKEDGTFYVPGYTGKWGVEGDRLILTSAGWEVWFRIRDNTFLDETTGRRYVKTTLTPSPTPTKPEAPTPVPQAIALVGDFSITVSKVDRQENTTTLYFAITKVADTDSEGGELQVTLTDDHGNQYSGTLNVSLGGAPLGVIPLLPVGFTYVDSVNIKMPKIAPIETIRFGEEPEIDFKEIQLVKPDLKREFGELMIGPEASVSLGKYLTFTFSGPKSDVIGWALPVTIANTEYNPLPVEVRFALLLADGRISWFKEGSVTGQVPGSGKTILKPRIFTISQAIKAIEPASSWTILVIFVDKSTGEQTLRLIPISAEELPAIPERIAFSFSFRDLSVVSADGTNIINLFTTTGFGEYAEAVAWSPDGTKIALNVGWRIYVMDADGSRPTKIFEGSGLREGVAWSPDGTKIAFCAGGAIYIANADGSDRKKLDVGGFDASAPSWSPDGTKIAYFDGAGINTIKTDGSGKTRIWGETYGLPYLYAAYFPRWSPDGNKIAIGIHPKLGSGIIIIRADGSSFGQLPMGHAPAWSPDGTKLAYVHEGEIWITRVTEGSIPSGVKLTDGLNLMGYSGPGAELWILAWAPAFKLVEGGIKPPPPDETKKDFIISDKEYRDYQSMSLIQIQRFLEDHNSFLASYRTQDVEGVERSAAEIIFNVTQKYHINPEVIIVTLQKEQSLITTPPGKESESQLRKAMGYENPDYYGFANQIDAGTWQLDKYYRDIETKGTTVSGWGVGITKITQDGVYVTPENIATACLYSYTPWAGYQWGGNRSDVGGNYLFWYFYDKFGFYELTPTPMTGEILIGSLLSLTGPLATTGVNSKVAIDMAVEEVNEFLKASGAKWTLKIVTEDTQTDPDVALTKLESLAAKGIRLIVGSMFSSEVQAIKGYADTNKILVVSQSSTALALAIPDDFIFRFCPPDLTEGPVIARLMYDDGKRYVIPVWRSDGWGDDTVDAVKTRFEGLGGTFLKGIRYETPPPREFSAEAADLASKVDRAVATYGADQVGVLYIGFAELSDFFTAASEYDVLWTVKWYGYGFWGMIEDPVVAKFSAATRFIQIVFAPTKSDKYQKVHDRLVAELGKEPFPWDASPYVAYDIVWALAQSLLTVNKYDSEAIREVLPDVTESIFGASGRIVLDENGDRVSADYDLWTIVYEAGEYKWKCVGTYVYATDSITWL